MSKNETIQAWMCQCGNHDPRKLLVIKGSKIDKGKLHAYCRVCGDEVLVPDKLKKELLKGVK